MNSRSRKLGILLLTTLMLSAALSPTSSVAAGPLVDKIICLDPGHGGYDPGAVNGDLYESHINLDVSYGLKALFEADGATVVMTREGDDYRTNNDRYTFCNAAEATILVSVHTNSVVDPSPDGSMVLYMDKTDKPLAQAIYNVMYPALKINAPTPIFTGYGLSRFASGVLLKSDMPAAMVEPVFMSNPAEAALLAQPIDGGCEDLSCRRGQIVRAVHDGVLAYFEAGAPLPIDPPGRRK